MGRHRAKWATLQARMPTGSGFSLASLNQVGLRRHIAARMHMRGVRSHWEYMRLLEANPGEYAALASALQSTIRRGSRQRQASMRRGLGSQFRRWVAALPLPAVVAEGLPSTRRLRLLASNRAARDLFGEAEGALKATSDHCQWLNPDETACSEQEMPLYQAIWRGRATFGRRLLLRDAAGQVRAVVVNACRMPGRRPRAIETVLTGGGAGSELGAEGSTPLARYRRIFEEAPDPLILTDQAGLLLEANAHARQLLAAGEGAIEGAPLAGFLSDGALRTFHETLATLAHSGEAEARVGVQAQPELALEAKAREIETDEGPVVEWTLHDVTGHVASEELRRDLVDLVLHDLRSPLATSILGVEASERGLERGDPARAQRSLSMVAAALRRLGRLVDSLLDVSRLEAGQPILQLAEVEPAQVLSAVAGEVELALATHKLKLEMDVPDTLPTIVADADMFFRAVINLLDNAIKFSPPNTRVQLVASAQDRGVLVAVTDEGPGIPRHLQRRIFEKFVSVHLPQAPRGYGLGLSFCKLAVEAHGGWVAVDSAPGQGSTFALWFPANPETEGAGEGVSAE